MIPATPGNPAGAPLSIGTRLKISVPASGALYEGHFPGRPILPGIGLLDLALDAMAAAGASPVLREISFLRFRRIVEPGEDLELEVKGVEPGGAMRLELCREAEVVAKAIVTLGEPSPAISAALVPKSRRLAGTPDLDELIPHRTPMRFVEGIEEEFEGGMVCAVGVPARSAFVEEGSAPALVALEMAAQSAAVLEAILRSREGRPGGARLGYLVGARDVRFTRSRVPAGESLFASIRFSGLAPPLSTYTFEVGKGEEVVATGSLSTWITATAV